MKEEILDWINGMISDLNTIKSHIEKEEYAKAGEYTDSAMSDAEYLSELVELANE